MEDARDKPTYTVDTQNLIAARHSEENEAPEGTIAFGSECELEALVADWPSSRLIDVWNRLPGNAPVKKFTDRKTAVRRIWKALENRPMPQTAARPAREVKSRKAKSRARTGSAAGTTKSETVLALLRQPGGATLKVLMAATGWQAHSIRGFVSGQLTKKMGLKVKSFQRDGERVYTVRP